MLIPALRVRSVCHDQNDRLVIPVRNTPNNVYGVTRMVFLQEKNTMPFRIIRVFLYDHRRQNARKYLSCCQAIFYQFIVSMLGYPHLTDTDQITNSLKKLAQVQFSKSIMATQPCIAYYYVLSICFCMAKISCLMSSGISWRSDHADSLLLMLCNNSNRRRSFFSSGKSALIAPSGSSGAWSFLPSSSAKMASISL